MSIQTETFPPSLGDEASTGANYMLINSYKSGNAITSGNTAISSVGLYIPAGSLKTDYTGQYTVKDGGATQARLGSAASGSGSLVESGNAASDLATATATSFLDKGGILSASGSSPNKYQALVYQGPSGFRTHSFTFKFFPKNNVEAETVQRIIAIFKSGTLPRGRAELARGSNRLRSAYFTSPHHHKITFFSGGSENKNLFHISTSVITAMSVNYDPQTMVGFHNDGQPVGIDLSLTFQEIEIQISDNLVTGGANLDATIDTVIQNQSRAARADGLEQLAQRGIITDGRAGFSSPTRDF